MGGFAWVTLATNDSYSLGALVLAHSLKQVGTTHQLAVLVTPGVTNAMKEKLAQVFNVVQEVNILDSRDESNLKLLKRPELGITFTKLHCWRLTQFDKCVFLDADTLVLQNSDELFEREEFSAAPDVGWPDCFNSGVFVYRPSLDTFEKLIQFALEKGSFDGGDQGLLNLYFSEWAHKDISKHLPFIYNMCSTACYSYLPAFKQFGANAKIIHFIGPQKPWLSYFNTETKRVQPSSDSSHLQEVLQRWWDIFCSLIHPVLSPAMAGLAGAFSQLTLGVARTAEQDAVENVLRKQAWEVGNIDYLGRDSFDNIWSKIIETISSAPEVSTPQSTNDTAPAKSQSPPAPHQEAIIVETPSLEYSLDNVNVQSDTSVEVPAEPVSTIHELPKQAINEPSLAIFPVTSGKQQEQTNSDVASDIKTQAAGVNNQVTDEEKIRMDPAICPSLLKELKQEESDEAQQTVSNESIAVDVPKELASPVLPICPLPCQPQEEKSEVIIENVSEELATSNAELALKKESSTEPTDCIKPEEDIAPEKMKTEAADAPKKSPSELAICAMSKETEKGKAEVASVKLLEEKADIPEVCSAIPVVCPMPPKKPEEEKSKVASEKIMEGPEAVLKECPTESSVCPVPDVPIERVMEQQMNVPTDLSIEPTLFPAPSKKVSDLEPAAELLKESLAPVTPGIVEVLNEKVPAVESTASVQSEKSDHLSPKDETNKVTAPIPVDEPMPKEPAKVDPVLVIPPVHSTAVPEEAESECQTSTSEKTEPKVDNSSCPLPLEKDSKMSEEPAVVIEGTKATDQQIITTNVPVEVKPAVIIAESQTKEPAGAEATPSVEQMKQVLAVDDKIPQTPPPKESAAASMATPTPPPRKQEKQKKGSGKSKK